MLYAFFGTDTVGVRQKAHDLIQRHESRGEVAVRITPENFSENALKDSAGSVSLFGGKQLFIVDTPSEDATMCECVFGNLDLLAESPNTFVLIEGGLLAPQKKKLEKYAEKLVEVTASRAERFNMFALAEALARKDKKSLWMLLARSKREGISAEEIIGMLFWQVKMLRLAERAGSAAEAGVKPFVFSKAKSALKKFKEGEADKLSEQLITFYHEGHLGTVDIDLALEKWVLEL